MTHRLFRLALAFLLILANTITCQAGWFGNHHRRSACSTPATCRSTALPCGGAGQAVTSYQPSYAPAYAPSPQAAQAAPVVVPVAPPKALPQPMAPAKAVPVVPALQSSEDVPPEVLGPETGYLNRQDNLAPWIGRQILEGDPKLVGKWRPVRKMEIPAGDSYNFGQFLNAARARRGLHPLAHHAGLSQDAALNSSMGLGHAFMGRARRQNAGIGDASSVWAAWTVSEGHWQAMFDPSVTAYGIAYVNGVWTYGAF